MKLRGSSKQNRPRFLLSILFKDLINVSSESGSCFIKWALKDGTGTSIHALSSDHKGNHLQLYGINQNTGLTPIQQINNHRVVWGYDLEVPLHIKLYVDNNGVLIGKLLILEVYLDKNTNKTDHTLKQTTSAPNEKKNKLEKVLEPTATELKKTVTAAHAGVTNGPNISQINKSKYELLGTVKIDITDYIRPDEQFSSNRYLLQNSKVNTILQLSMKLKLIRGKYTDFTIKKPSNKPGAKSIAQSGIGDIFQQEDSTIYSSLGGSTKVNGSSESDNLYAASTAGSKVHTSVSSVRPSYLVEDAYMKSLNLSWDRRPGEFNVQECIEDIINGGDGWARNEKGVKLIDLKTYGDREEFQ
ncbi:hypothetical protein TPHA_0E00720 [Tetrapisispora phaffii CBS 4417]|uniref:C2 NT-type domain-containing protein n=1 Tax=Tetrapisispora phaffii (strain ATCC 24235 / CBS 4417 / NBRC 1672 / NRRL Y-8282 / UCD 70-5) TaxID=1071381 RepID=G8BTD9_TETPH|nr:hypothetical protein TPHA_0E00720 [Tetrapisispora phaffii CBS 4417]CCE63167.1 hypothetical protein TPHA_0E00720 [Tetrapisispora phaffii CBS 4417]